MNYSILEKKIEIKFKIKTLEKLLYAKSLNSKDNNENWNF